MKVAIIILDYRGGQKLRRCLKSLREAVGEFKIIRIDNNQKNRGFAAGVNLGIRRAQKLGMETILLLNQDAWVSRNFLAPLLANPADVVSPTIKFKRAGRWLYDCGGKINWWLGRTSHLETNSLLNASCLIPDYVSGCALLIRRPVLEKIGLLDEKYFLYFEDVDFCLRARRAGFKIAVEPKSLVFHQLSDNRPLPQRRQLVKSNLIFINSWISPWRRPLAWFYWLLISVKILLS